jgi:hypothetical protein
MACGTGEITRLIAEELARQGRQARIIAVDPSADALCRGQKSMEEMGATADFFQGEAGDLPTLVQDVDAAFFCEAKAIAMLWLTPEEYSSLLKESGFSRVETMQERVMMTLDGLRDLGHYWLFIQGPYQEHHCHLEQPHLALLPTRQARNYR